MDSIFTRSIREHRRALLAIAGIALATTRIAAAAQITSGSGTIVGLVRDDSGAVLPGVTVTATSPNLQVPEVVTVTDSAGEYRLTPLPNGTYTVAFTLSGFQAVRRENIRLTVGFVAQIDVSLPVGNVQESITVSGASPIVDVRSTATTTQLTRDTLDAIPTSRSGIISLLAQVPSVRANLDAGGGVVGTPPTYRLHGMEAESWVTLDGVLTTDSRHGGNYFNYEAIDEARVQSASGEADVASRGVQVQMVTKSGSDQFRGSGLLAYTSQTFQSDNISDELASQGITSGNPLLSQTDQGGDLGGRIIRERLWFYGAARYRTQATQILDAFRPDGSPRENYQNEVLLSGKVSAQLNPSNRIIGFAHWTQKYTDSEGGPFNEWGSGTERCCPPLRSEVNKIEWERVQGSSLVTSLQFGEWGWTAPIGIENKDGSNVTIATDAEHGGGRVSYRDQVTLAQGGTNPSAGNFDIAHRYHAKGTLTWYRPTVGFGNHEIGAGFDYIPNQIGWEYYARGSAGDYRLVFNNGQAFQIEAFNNPATPRTRAHHTTIYIKDNWNIGRTLTLNVGARYARDNGFIPEQCREAGSFAPRACVDKIQSRIWNSVAPRVYFAYDIIGDGKTVLKGGWGQFNHVRTEDEVLPLHPFVATVSTYRWRDLNGNRDYDFGEVNLDPNGADFVQSVVRDTGNLTSKAVDNPDEKQPGIRQLTLTLEREVAANLAARVTGVYIKSFNEPRRLNLLRPYESYNIPITNPDPGPDGLVGTADDPGRSITYYEYPAELAGRDFQQTILVADPRSNETHTTIEVSLSKRLANRWQMTGSYSATKNDALAPKTRDTAYHAAASLDPNTEFNTGDHTWEWLGRVSASYVLPLDVTVSANYDHRSAVPQARQVLFRGGVTIPSIVLNVDPLGSLRLPSTNLVDFRVDKALVLGGRQTLSLRANVYNILNASTVTGWTVRAGATYLRPTSIVRPRIVEFGLNYRF